MYSGSSAQIQKTIGHPSTLSWILGGLTRSDAAILSGPVRRCVKTTTSVRKTEAGSTASKLSQICAIRVTSQRQQQTINLSPLRWEFENFHAGKGPQVLTSLRGNDTPSRPQCDATGLEATRSCNESIRENDSLVRIDSGAESELDCRTPAVSEKAK